MLGHGPELCTLTPPRPQPLPPATLRSARLPRRRCPLGALTSPRGAPEVSPRSAKGRRASALAAADLHGRHASRTPDLEIDPRALAPGIEARADEPPSSSSAPATAARSTRSPPQPSPAQPSSSQPSPAQPSSSQPSPAQPGPSNERGLPRRAARAEQPPTGAAADHHRSPSIGRDPPSRAEQSRAEQSRAEQSRAEQSRAALDWRGRGSPSQPLVRTRPA